MNQRNLEEENKRLRRENEYLRYRLLSLGEGNLKEKHSVDTERLEKISRMASASQKKSYIGYLIGRLKISMLFRLWDRTRFAVRGFFLATKIWNFLIWFFAVLGVGTQFVLFAGAAAVLFPAVILLSIVLGLVVFFTSRGWKKKLNLLSEDRYYLFFVPKMKKKHEYFDQMVTDFAKKGSVFLIVSSFSASGYRGIWECRPNVYTVHISHYFWLKKHLHGDGVRVFL